MDSGVRWDHYTELGRKVALALIDCEIPFAFGGAIAYGYHAEPRATTDVDINIFLSSDKGRRVITCLEEHGFDIDPVAAQRSIDTTDQVRLFLDDVFVDLFFANFEFQESCARRARTVPFADVTVKALSAEDLVIWKVLFNRGKDWVDIRQILLTQGERFDAAYTLHWLDEILGPDDPARERLALEIERARRDLPG
jgi:hypothetical protein